MITISKNCTTLLVCAQFIPTIPNLEFLMKPILELLMRHDQTLRRKQCIVLSNQKSWVSHSITLWLQQPPWCLTLWSCRIDWTKHFMLASHRQGLTLQYIACCNQIAVTIMTQLAPSQSKTTYWQVHSNKGCLTGLLYFVSSNCDISDQVNYHQTQMRNSWDQIWHKRK